MNRHQRFVDWIRMLLFLSLLVASRAGAQVRPASADSILSGLVWMSRIPVDSTLPAPIRLAVDAYNRRSAAYVPKARRARDRESEMFLLGFADYERRLAAASSDPRKVELVRAYADSLAPPYEWEGLPEGPEREAAFADTYRAAHPDSPLAEIVALLAAHRWVCAAEAYQGERKAADEARSHERFVLAAAAAVESKDLLIRTAALRLQEHPVCFF